MWEIILSANESFDFSNLILKPFISFSNLNIPDKIFGSILNSRDSEHPYHKRESIINVMVVGILFLSPVLQGVLSTSWH